MGVLTAFSRTMYLTRYINDLQAKLNDVTGKKQLLFDKITKFTESSDLSNTDSAVVKELQAMKVKLQALDRKLDTQMQELKSRLQAAQVELQSANGMLQSNIQTSFQYNIPR